MVSSFLAECGDFLETLPVALDEFKGFVEPIRVTFSLAA